MELDRLVLQICHSYRFYQNIQILSLQNLAKCRFFPKIELKYSADFSLGGRRVFFILSLFTQIIRLQYIFFWSFTQGLYKILVAHGVFLCPISLILVFSMHCLCWVLPKSPALHLSHNSGRLKPPTTKWSIVAFVVVYCRFRSFLGRRE